MTTRSETLTDAARAVAADARKCYPTGLPRGVYVAVQSDVLRALEAALCCHALGRPPFVVPAANLAPPVPPLLESAQSEPPAHPSAADTTHGDPVMATKKAAPKQAPKVKAAKPKAAAKKPAKKAPDNGGATA